MAARHGGETVDNTQHMLYIQYMTKLELSS